MNTTQPLWHAPDEGCNVFLGYSVSFFNYSSSQLLQVFRMVLFSPKMHFKFIPQVLYGIKIQTSSSPFFGFQLSRGTPGPLFPCVDIVMHENEVVAYKRHKWVDILLKDISYINIGIYGRPTEYVGLCFCLQSNAQNPGLLIHSAVSCTLGYPFLW